MEMETQDVVKAVAKTVVSCGYGYVLTGWELKFCQKRNWKLASRYIAWTRKPKVFAVNSVIVLAMNLAAAELKAQQVEAARKKELAIHIANLEALLGR